MSPSRAAPLAFLLAGCAAAPAPPAAHPTSAEVLAATTPADWRVPDPENTLYVELAAGRVVIELAPAFAPHHAANIRALAREHYYDGLSIIRSQDNYVVQWGDPAEKPEEQRPIVKAQRTIPAEFARALDASLPFEPLPDGDVYAPEVGLADGFPAARDRRQGLTWLTHCYGMVGAGRGDTADSGGGAELYVVIGNSPRHLDRNVTLVGRVLSGMPLLSTLPRGTGALGFYEKPAQYVPLLGVRVAADVPPAERTEIEVLRTDTPAFRAWLDSRRTRREPWFLDSVGHLELCNAPVPVRPHIASR